MILRRTVISEAEVDEDFDDGNISWSDCDIAYEEYGRRITITKTGTIDVEDLEWAELEDFVVEV